MTDDTNSKPRLKSGAVIRAVLLIAAGGLLLWTIRSVDVAQVLALLGDVGPGVLLLPLTALTMAVTDAAGWRHLLSRLDGRFRFSTLVQIRIISDAVFLSVPGGTLVSDAVAPALLKRQGFPFSCGIAVAAVRKCLFAVADGFYVLVAGLVGFEFLRAHSVELLGLPGLNWLTLVAAAGLVVVAAIVMLVLTYGAVAERTLSLLDRVSFGRLRTLVTRWTAAFRQTDRQFGRAFGLKHRAIWAAAPWYVATVFVSTAETWLILTLLGVDVSLVQILSFEPLLSMIPALFFVLPAGLGVIDAGYVVFFAAIGVPDPINVGTAFIVLRRTNNVLWTMLGYSLLFFERRSDSQPE